MVTMSRILGPNGEPIAMEDIREPQTAKVGSLHREFQGHPSRGLTPTRLAQILESAEQGDLIAQFELFEDMEEKDGHIASEMNKRRRAVTGLPWTLQPPANATAKEKSDLKKLQEAVESIDDFDDMLYDVSDAIGKGFAALEYEGWQRLDGIWLPKTITHRPQTWFRLHRGFRQEIRLRDYSPEGAPLQPFGWLVHTHKAKSGYLERASLFRQLVWPYLFKNYSVADLAEWLEIYGIPMRIGKYPPGASEKEKATLLRALVSVGHNAAGIMPAGMEVDFKETATGDADPFDLMMSWCERTESKVIIGSTLTSQADRGSNTNALGNVHNEVRHDLRDADARLIGASITRNLIYPIAVLNGWADSIRRSPRFAFDISETEDIQTFGGGLRNLVGLGMKIPRQWAQEKLGIPEPEDGDELLGSPSPDPADSIATPPTPDDQTPPSKVKASAQTRAQTYPEKVTSRLTAKAAAPMQAIMDRLVLAVEESSDFAALSQRLLSEFDDLPTAQLNELVGQALLVADLGGRSQVLDEVANDTDA